MFYGMNNTQLLDFQFELQQSKEKIKNTPIILSLRFRYIKLYEDRYEYWIKKKIIKKYLDNNPNFVFKYGIGNQNFYTYEKQKDESYQDFQVDREIWMNYDKIEVIEENIEYKNKNYYFSNLSEFKQYVMLNIINKE